MEENFPGYYSPIENEFSAIWKTCFFVLDSNVLLNLYRYSPTTQEDLFQLLETISSRLWLPYQVALEYQRSRLKVIEEEHDLHQPFVKHLREIYHEFQSPMHHPYISTELLKSLEDVISQVEDQFQKQKKTLVDLMQDDTIRSRLSKVFSGKIGKPYTDERLESVFQEGEKRFQRQVPPGYCDIGKSGTKPFGDLIVWLQTIDEVKQRQQPLIFITGDQKADWFLSIPLRNEKIPHPELRQELKLKTGFKLLHLYRRRFLEKCESAPEIWH